MTKPKIRIDVMISSTSKDLPRHRQAVKDAIERVALSHPIYDIGLNAVVMETGTADTVDAIDFSLRMVNKSEIYIGILGFRYGSVPEENNPKEISITEMEYRRAQERDIPILMFVMADDHPSPDTMAEAKAFIEANPKSEAKLKALKEEVQKKVVGSFKSPDELKTLVLQALHDMERIEAIIAKNPYLTVPEAEKAKRVPPEPPETYYNPRYITGGSFVGRRAELELLDDWAASDDPMLVVEAIGGMGKSALTWEWVHSRAMNHYAGIFWWSFYESGATMQAFLRHALAYFYHEDPESPELLSMTYVERAKAVLAELDRHNYLIVLDGLERILVAYHRLTPSHLSEDDAEDAEKKDDTRAPILQADGELLRQLTGVGKSKILISTRLLPTSLAELHDKDSLLRGVRRKILNGLHRDDALTLAESLQVIVKNRDIFDAFMERFGRHSLLLKIIIGLAKSKPRDKNTFDLWHKRAGKDFKLSEVDLRQNRTHILAAALADLEPEHRKLLSQLAAFKDAVDYDTALIFNPFAPIKPEAPEKPSEPDTWWLNRLKRQLENETDSEARANLESQISAEETELEEARQVYQTALADYQRLQAEYETAFQVYEQAYEESLDPFDTLLLTLQERGLLQKEGEKYDLHPVVRAYAFEQLEERESTFDQMRNYFEGKRGEDAENPTELVHLSNALEIFRALMGAGRLEQASEFYWNNLGDPLHYTVASYPTMLELLQSFFTAGLDQAPPDLSPMRQGQMVNQLALAFYYMGRTEAALKLQGVQIGLNIAREHRGDIGAGLRNYANSLRDDNQLSATLACRQLALEVGQAAEDEDGIAMSWLFLLDIYRDIGEWAKAAEAYQNFVANPPTRQKIYWQTDAERLYAYTLFYQGLDPEPHLSQGEQFAQASQNAVDLRILQVLRGEIALQKGQTEQAVIHFEAAIASARKSGDSVLWSYLGDLARVRLAQGNLEEARRLIEESGSTRLNAAEIYYGLGEMEKAREYALNAYKRAWADGEPYVWRYDLEKAKALLAKLGLEPPILPPFDPAKVAPIPYEAEIRALIEKWKAERDS